VECIAQPPKRRAPNPRRAAALDGAPEQRRALAIRNHVVPLIRALAGAHRAGGLPVLLAVLGPFTLSYRRPLVGQADQPCRLEIRRRRRLLVLEWTGTDFTLVTFQPGPWEQEVLRLTPPRR